MASPAAVRFDFAAHEPESPAKVWSPSRTPSLGAITPTTLNDDNQSERAFAPPTIEHFNTTRSRRIPGPSDLRSKISRTIGWDKQTSLQSLACYWSQGTSGANDSSLGALIPSIERYYDINYVVVSCLFLGTCSGYIAATFLNSPLQRKFGRGKVLPTGAALQMLGYCVLLLPGLPFPVMPVAFAFIGFGSAVQQAISNTYIAALPNAAQRLGMLHASYGFGGFLSPLVATAFVTAGLKWSLYFAVTMSVAFTSLVLHVLAFKLEKEPQSATTDATDLGSLDNDARQEGTNQPAVDVQINGAKDSESVKSPLVWTIAGFLFLYVGAEVSIGGWIVSFLLDERHAPGSAGYVASGFWAGITLGRIVLPRINVAIGEKLAITIYIVLIAVLEILVWQVRQFIANAVVVAIVGFLLGPLFPTSISLLTKLIPRNQHTFSVGFVSAFGATGSAVVPFICGILAQKYDTTVLHPLVIACMAVMLASWQFVPSVARRVD